LEIEVTKVTKVKLVCQVFKEIKVIEEIVENQEKRGFRVSQDYQGSKEFKAIKVKKVR
jgi:hypothetical protein